MPIIFPCLPCFLQEARQLVPAQLSKACSRRCNAHSSFRPVSGLSKFAARSDLGCYSSPDCLVSAGEQALLFPSIPSFYQRQLFIQAVPGISSAFPQGDLLVFPLGLPTLVGRSRQSATPPNFPSLLQAETIRSSISQVLRFANVALHSPYNQILNLFLSVAACVGFLGVY